MSSTIDLVCDRGDSAEWTVVARKDGVGINLTGGSVTFTARRNYASPQLFQRTVGSGITLANQGTSPGQFAVRLLPTDTTQLANESSPLVYDIQVYLTSGEQWTVARGALSVSPVAGIL